jgi:hypothetical protein
MTVNANELARKEYTGNGSTTIFSYDFKIFLDTHIEVYLAGVLQTLGTHYTVAGVGEAAGGVVTFVTAPGNGVSVVLLLAETSDQATDYIELSEFPAKAHEDALDKLTLLVQQTREALRRGLKFAKTSLKRDYNVPDPVADKVLGWNADATALVNKDLVSVSTDAVLSNATPQDVAATGTPGTSLDVSRQDHRHKLGILTTLGDLIVRDGSGPARLGVGAEGTFLKIVGGVPAYGAGSGALTDHDHSVVGQGGPDVVVGEKFALKGDISPAQITTNQNDYNPAGLADASTLRINSDAARTITGLAGGEDGRLMIVHNVGAFGIMLSHEDGGSTAANRFSVGANYTIPANKAVVLQYDSTSSRWRIVAAYPDITAGSGAVNIAVQVFTGTGTWTKPAGLLFARVIAVGGGGGGGGTSGTGAGSGGGGGGYCEEYLMAGSLGATEAVTVGSAGSAGPGSGSGNGGAGGNSSFGAHLTANGGAGGGGKSGSVEFVAGASGGGASGGNINIPGGPGGHAHKVPSFSDTPMLIAGKGGDSVLGKGGKGAISTTAGTDGGAFGGGGGGSAGTSQAGFIGAQGIVVVVEYKT